MIFKNARVLNADFVWENADVSVHGRKIAEVGKIGNIPEGEEIIDCTDCLIIPAFADIHTHGAVGVDTMGITPQEYKKWSDYLASNGVLHFMPTTVTGTQEETCETLKTLAGIDGVWGIHLEGPYIDKERNGAHRLEDIRPFSADEEKEMIAAGGGAVRRITLAARYTDGIETSIKRGLQVSIGHTTADYAEGVRAIHAGATSVTHIFNAMEPLLHRSPNRVGAAFDTDCYVELICDGIHVNPCVVRMLYKMFGRDRLVLISDSMSAAGLSDGEYMLGDMFVTVSGGIARTREGAIAGSTRNLYEMVKCAASFGIPAKDAVKMASANPYAVMGDKKSGRIAANLAADLLVTDSKLNIKCVVKDGEIVWKQ